MSRNKFSVIPGMSDLSTLGMPNLLNNIEISGKAHGLVQSSVANAIKLEPTGIASGVAAIISTKHATNLAIQGKKSEALTVGKQAGMDALGAVPLVGKLATGTKLAKALKAVKPVAEALQKR
jgi:hypothetical protein